MGWTTLHNQGDRQAGSPTSPGGFKHYVLIQPANNLASSHSLPVGCPAVPRATQQVLGASPLGAFPSPKTKTSELGATRDSASQQLHPFLPKERNLFALLM